MDMEKIKNMTPQEIVTQLDKYIIGQAEAKRNVAIALRNRWRRMNVDGEIKNEIIPNNILMIGATGVGKTEIARRLAKLSDAPFTKVEASKFTEVGYVGRDVESMVRDLVEQSVNLVKLIKKEEVKLKAEESVNNLILDILIPPINKVQSNINLSLSFIVSSSGKPGISGKSCPNAFMKSFTLSELVKYDALLLTSFFLYYISLIISNHLFL